MKPQQLSVIYKMMEVSEDGEVTADDMKEIMASMVAFVTSMFVLTGIGMVMRKYIKVSLEGPERGHMKRVAGIVIQEEAKIEEFS